MKINDKNIDELLIAYLLHELDEETNRDVELWISSSDDHQSKFNKIKNLWNISEHSNIDFDDNSGWEKISTKIKHKSNHNQSIHKSINKSRVIRLWMSIAASVILLFSAYFVYQNNSNIPALKTTYVVAEITPTSTTLSDQSMIKLNTGATISYNTDFDKTKRELNLQGEAFFDIHRNVKKPFIIHTSDSRIEVLGTSFNINANPKDSIITVYVKSGLVRFSYLPTDTTKAYSEINLNVGEKVIYNKNTRQIKLTDDASFNQIDTYWMDNKLAFEGVKLKKVARILEIIYDVKIVPLNKSLYNCPISVKFENNQIDEIMNVIASTFNIELESVENTYILKGKACEK